MSISPPAGTTADVLLSDVWSKQYIAWIFLGKYIFLPYSGDYKLSDQKFCAVQGFALLWLLLLWFDFEDDTPRCINLEWQWLLWDDLTLACH